MWLEHCYWYFQPVYSAILLKSRKAQSFVTHCLRNAVRINVCRCRTYNEIVFVSLNFHRRHRLVNENTLIFVAVFVTLTKLSELSSQFSSRQRKLKWLRQLKFSSSSSLTKKHQHTHTYTVYKCPIPTTMSVYVIVIIISDESLLRIRSFQCLYIT